MKKTGNLDFNIVKKGYDPDQVDKYVVELKNSTETSLSEQKQRIFELKDALLSTENKLKEYKDKSNVVSKAIVQAVAKADEIEKLSIIKYRQEIERLKAFHDKWMNYYNKILRQYPLDEDLSAASKFNQQMKKILFNGDEPLKNEDVYDAARNLEKTFDDENNRLGAKTKGGKVTVKVAPQKDNLKIKRQDKLSDSQKKILADNGFDPIARISKYLEDAANVDIESNEASTVDSEQDAEEILSKDELKAKEANLKTKREAAQEERTSLNNAFADKKKDTAAAVDSGDYSDRSALGFSFQEALNPKDDLEQIMKDLGLFSDDN